MPCLTTPSEAQSFFERVYGERPPEPYEELHENWKQIAGWEEKRAEFFAWMTVYDDVSDAWRMAQ